MAAKFFGVRSLISSTLLSYVLDAYAEVSALN